MADSSYEFDAAIKAEMYAKAEIPEYWIINLNEDQIEVYKKPNMEAYQDKEIYKIPSSVENQTLSIEINTQMLFL